MPLQTHHRFAVLIVSFVLLLSKCHLVGAQSWPQYRGPDGDGKATQSKEIGWSGGQPKTIWKVPTPLGFSSFSVSDGRAITLIAEKDDSGSEAQTCVALDAQTGEKLWSYALSQHDYGRRGGGAGARGNKGGDGPRSTPAIDGDRVYVYDGQLLLVCLRADSGELVWKVDVLNDFAGRNIAWASAISPVVDGDRVYVAGGGAGQSMMALNKMTGDVIWKTGDEMMTHATPVVREVHGKRQVIFYMQSGLVALDPDDGTEQWRVPYEFRTSSAASPVLSGNRVYCSAGYGVGAGLFEISDSMAVTEVWRKPNRLINHWSTPVLHDGHLYGLFSFKKYGKGPLQCVELSTGDIKWEKAGFGPGNCILVGETLVVLSDSGELVLVKATPDSYQESVRAKVLKGKCWSTPAYTGGKVYVRSTEEGACIELGEQAATP